MSRPHGPHPKIRDELLHVEGMIDPLFLFPTVLPEAGEMALSNPYAFALAACLDRGTESDVIWTIP